MGYSPLVSQGLRENREPIYKTLLAPYGRSFANLGETHYGFTGQEYNMGTDLNDFHARSYSQSLGRFASLDPLPTASVVIGQSPYVYVHDQPLVGVDSSGGECRGCVVILPAPHGSNLSTVAGMAKYAAGSDVLKRYYRILRYDQIWNHYTHIYGEAAYFKIAEVVRHFRDRATQQA